jgi:CIC family chloride channel protein
MRREQHAWRRLTASSLRQDAGFLLLVSATGAGMGGVAVGFQQLLRGANRLFFGGFRGGLTLDMSVNLLARPYVALVPALGGLLVGTYFYVVVRRPAGHGVSEVLVALAMQGSRVPWITSIHTAIGSAITIGSGGSAGPEGPIIQIGAALASGLGQRLRLPAARLRLLLAAGAGAGLAGMYHAPLTGAAFASEVLLEELDPRTFSLLALAAVAASAVAGQIQHGAALVMPAIPAPPPADVPVDVLLGLLAAPIGVALLVLVHRLGERADRAPLPRWLLPGLGGLAVGLLGLLFPLVLGSGEAGIQLALNGTLAFPLLLMLPFAKLLATATTLGSGGTGGVFTPSLFIGATLGGAFGVIVRAAWPGASPESAYALVGMGTVVAAAVNAPLSAILLVCEFTGRFALLPEIVAAAAASVLLARQLHPESIYTLPLRAHGIDRGQLRQTPLARIAVAEAMSTTWPVMTPEQTLRQALLVARRTGRAMFPVVDPGGHYRGLLSLEAVASALAAHADDPGGPLVPDGPVADLVDATAPIATPGDTLHEVALRLGAYDQPVAIIPVLDRRDGRYLGVVERTVLLRAYSGAPPSRNG